MDVEWVEEKGDGGRVGGREGRRRMDGGEQLEKLWRGLD